MASHYLPRGIKKKYPRTRNTFNAILSFHMHLKYRHYIIKVANFAQEVILQSSGKTPKPPHPTLSMESKNS